MQTDNGTKFTCKYISEDTLCPLDIALEKAGVAHKLIPPRTPWHNGKVECSHCNDQRYFYDWEKFSSVDDLNAKLPRASRLEQSENHAYLGQKKPQSAFAKKTDVSLIHRRQKSFKTSNTISCGISNIIILPRWFISFDNTDGEIKNIYAKENE